MNTLDAFKEKNYEHVNLVLVFTLDFWCQKAEQLSLEKKL